MRINLNLSKIFGFCLLLNAVACVPHKQLLLLNDVGQEVNEAITNQTEMRIQPEDLLSITVSSYNIDASKPFNGESGGIATMAAALQGQNNVAEMLTGYFVDQEGFLDFPSIGRVFVNQKTLTEVKTILLEKLKVFLKDAVVNVRFINLKISVLGEVNRPGVIRLTNKRLTVFEAIGMAGDMTNYSNRANVLLIREKDGKRAITRLNLQSTSIFHSPYYYLQQNDVLIVEPTKSKVNTVADPTNKAISLISTGISILSLTLILLKK
jgi:polysaccharide biosynthesis/export protein